MGVREPGPSLGRPIIFEQSILWHSISFWHRSEANRSAVILSMPTPRLQEIVRRSSPRLGAASQWGEVGLVLQLEKDELCRL
jgi:hypothetical protein